jgi:multiple sugar transport system permease protein
MSRRFSDVQWAAFLSLAPALLLGALFIFVPLLLSIYLSMWDWPLLGLTRHFQGFDNWRRLLIDPWFWRSLRVTCLYTLGAVPAGAAISLLLALALRQATRGKGLLRTIYYLPVAMPGVAAALFWKAAFQPQAGVINSGLRGLGLPSPPWLIQADWALASLIIVSIWQHAGYYMVIFLTGLANIPRVLYDAARSDGAGRWTCFWHITWPLLRPTTALVLITGAIFSFQVFGPVFVLTGGGPTRGTTTIAYYLYERAFGFHEMGYGATLGWAMVLATLPFVVLGFWLQARTGDVE